MSEHPPVEDAVSTLQEQFPDKQMAILTSPIEIARLPAVVEQLRNRRAGGIVALFTKVWEVVTLHRLRLSRMEKEGVNAIDVVPIAEGYLCVGMVKSRVPAAKPRMVRRAKAVPVVQVATRPEVEVVEGAEIRELDLSAVVRRITRKAPLRALQASERAELHNVIIKRGMARMVGGQLGPTVAGMLVYGHRPDLWIEGARIQVNVDGVERVFSGSFKRIVREALRWEPLVEGFGDALVGPALVNSLVHRDWSEAHREQPVEVVRERERIEIRNPGSLAPGEGSRPTRNNPTLHSLVRRQRMAGRRGCGLGSVTAGLERLGARPFSLVGRDRVVRFVMEVPWRVERAEAEEVRHEDEAIRTMETGDLVRSSPACERSAMTMVPATVAICPMVSKMEPLVRAKDTPATRPAISAPTPDECSPRAKPPGSRRSPTERQSEVLDLLRRQSDLTTREIIEALGWTRSTTRAVIAALVEEGQIEGCADAARSPSQRYRPVPCD